MALLSFDKPAKVRSTEEHNEMYISDSGVAGTYVPNMSDKDMLAWKAKYIGGNNPRIEIRKTLANKMYVNIKLIVTLESVQMSQNGTAYWNSEDWFDLHTAILEARSILRGSI